MRLAITHFAVFLSLFLASTITSASERLEGAGSWIYDFVADEDIGYAHERARMLVTLELSDPDSATFRKERIKQVDGGYIVCGDMNAKNRMGGYAGYRNYFVVLPNNHMKFLYRIVPTSLLADTENTTAANFLFCSDLSVSSVKQTYNKDTFEYWLDRFNAVFE